MANYLTYPFKTMRITQRYDGSTSHLPHMTGTPKEYALDEGGIDTGRDWLFCPCDKMKIVRIYGVGNKGVNSLWLTSTTKCDIANGKQSVVTIILTHPNDDDLKKLKQGQTIKRGQAICREGTDGASGNHIHMAVGLGSITGNGWVCNSKNKYVLTTTGGAIKPEDAFFVDPAFTTVKSANGIAFKKLPTATNAKSAVTYQTTSALNIRSGAGSNYNKVGQYDKGVKVSVTDTKTVSGVKWGKTSKGWICLEYAKKVSK